MFGRLRSGPARRAAAAAATLSLAGAGLLVVASPAYAVPFPFTDSFEGVPTDRWVPDVVPGQTAVRLGNDARARTGTKLATLIAGPLVPSTARIYRTVTPDSTQPLPFSCSLGLYGRRAENVPGPDPESVEVQVKIRSGGPDGAVTLAKGQSFYSTAGWARWEVGTMWWPTSTFTIDITAYHGIAQIDDVGFTCIGAP